MPHIFRNPLGGFVYLLILFLTASIGSVLIMAPLMPLMVLYPAFYRKIMDNLMGLWLTLPVGLIELMFDVKFYITGDKIKINESCLIMMNHRTTIDWLFFWEVFWQQSSVKREKIILKKSLKAVPGFGWAMQVAMYIFLARKWDVDQPWIKMMLDYFSILKYKAQILIFPEGTDLNPKSKSRSDSYAKKNGLQYYEYVLHPRTTGFVYVAQTMRKSGIIDAIYDVTVGYPCQIPTFGNWTPYVETSLMKFISIYKGTQFLLFLYQMKVLRSGVRKNGGRKKPCWRSFTLRIKSFMMIDRMEVPTILNQNILV